MAIKVNGLGMWWMVSLLSVASLAAADLGLVEAAKQGDKEAIRSLLKQRVDVNTQQADGTTALAWAAYRDDLETAGLLIGAGANANAPNVNGVTPLSLACTNGSAAMVDRLLKAGAKPNEPEFMQCARAGNLEAVKSLLTRGANVNARESRGGQTALMWAVTSKHPEVVQALIERGADVNASSKGGFTPLMFSAQQGDLETARTLLAAGAKVNAVTGGEGLWPGMTPLLLASSSGHEALSVYLLEKGADVNAEDENGYTAMHFALMNGLVLFHRIRMPKYPSYMNRPNMLGLVKALLAMGGNPNARVKKISDMFAPITRSDPYPGSVSPVGATPFLLAAITYDVEAMRILAAGGADPRMVTEIPAGLTLGKDGFPDPTTKATLVAAGKMNDHEAGPWGLTAVMLAAGLTRWRTGGVTRTEELETRALEAVKLAVELGVDVNATDTLGMTALHGAAFHGSERIIQFLAEKGAKLDAKDISGQTPLHKAMNIKPPGQLRGVAWHRSLIALGIAPKSTAELLLKLGATPVNPSDAEGDAGAVATNAGQ